MAVVVAPCRDGEFVSLGATRQGTLFKKHILSKGTLLYPDAPGGKVEVDDEFFDKLVANFSAGYCPIVQVPLAGPKNEHSEDPERNLGRVVDLVLEGDKLFALIDARKHAEDFGKTLLGASAMMSLNYVDTATQKKVGPTLLHVAVTNRPYVTDLDDYEMVAASVSEYLIDGLVVLTQDDPDGSEGLKMTKEELIALLKSEHGVDVEALQVAAGASETLSAALSKLNDAGVISLTAGDTLTQADVVTAVAQLATKNVELSETVEGLVVDKHTAEVDALVRGGFIEPARRDAMLELRLSNADLFGKLVPENPIVSLTGDGVGVTPPDPDPQLDIDKEIERLAALANTSGFAKTGA